MRWAPVAPPSVNLTEWPDDVIRRLTREGDDILMLYSEAACNLGKADFHINALQDSHVISERKVELTEKRLAEAEAKITYTISQ